MHEGEIPIDLDLVRRLVARQFPAWATLPVRPIASTGTVNALYRLGDDLVVRLPRLEEWSASIEREARWLPRLAPALSVAVPEPVAVGDPEDGYPCRWSISRWLEGQPPSPEVGSHSPGLASDVAGFVVELQRIDASGAPPARRGAPVSTQDASTRRALSQLADHPDVDELHEMWDEALAAPPWDGPPVWVHGDLLPGNLLLTGGRLSGVLDFGECGAGDPACDLVPAWSLFNRSARDVFRAELDPDDAAWQRGRGWALSIAVQALPYYRHTNPAFAALATRMLSELLADRR